jgi:hypothetical protein
MIQLAVAEEGSASIENVRLIIRLLTYLGKNRTPGS